uniref:Uncharacterized protein n=1 Tax=Arundo donax TaxID=35708 RepID=A0A0A8Z4Q6_ARUDO
MLIFTICTAAVNNDREQLDYVVSANNPAPFASGIQHLYHIVLRSPEMNAKQSLCCQFEEKKLNCT